MTDKEKAIKDLKEVLDNLDITNKYRLNIIMAIEYLQKEPSSKLTWQDIQRIVKIADQIVDEDRRNFMAMEDEGYYKEVLARYVKQSEKP